MKLLADFHTHSKFSRFGHGKSSIEDMVYHANELGLQELAITDHGYKHFFRTSKEKMKKARAIIDDLNTWSKTKILLGIEANLISANGELDIDDDTLDLIDILVVGYHKMIKTNFAGFFGHQRKKQNAIDLVTNAYINAIERYPITIISHLDSVLKTDLYRIGCACRENGVSIEINERHCHWTQKQVDELIRSDCMFVVNSDAHIREDIGKVDRAFEIIKKYNIPTENIANVEFTPSEMSKEARELQIYYDLYKQKELEEKQKAEKYFKSKKEEVGSNLSREMEDALEKIASQKGIADYQRLDGVVEPEKILSDDKFKNDFSNAISNSNENKKSSLFTADGGVHFSDDLDEQVNETENLKNNENNDEIIEETYADDFEQQNLESNFSDNSSDTQFITQQRSYYGSDDNYQEQQVETIKNSSKENQDGNDDNSQLQKFNSEFFDETHDSSSYNLNKRSERKPMIGSVVVNMNDTYMKKQQKEDVVENEKSEIIFNKNGFIQTSVSQVNTKQKSHVQPVKKINSSRNGNGLLDFSSLKEDDDK